MFKTLETLLWNYFYSWGTMLMDCQNFAGLWEHNFVVIGLLHYNTGQFTTLVNVREDVYFW